MAIHSAASHATALSALTSSGRSESPHSGGNATLEQPYSLSASKRYAHKGMPTPSSAGLDQYNFLKGPSGRRSSGTPNPESTEEFCKRGNQIEHPPQAVALVIGRKPKSAGEIRRDFQMPKVRFQGRFRRWKSDSEKLRVAYCFVSMPVGGAEDFAVTVSRYLLPPI
jgi:hypothetical protein